jgi:hypothetical protein
MPHPKNGVKLTGSTHPPEVGDDELLVVDGPDDGVPEVLVVEELRIYGDADGTAQPSPPAQDGTAQWAFPESRTQKLKRRAGQVEARAPWLTIGGALLFGWLVAKMLRR